MDLSHMKGWIQEILVIFFNFGRLDVFVDIMREYGVDLGEKNSCSMYFEKCIRNSQLKSKRYMRLWKW